MSSLTTCSGQGVVVQAKRKQKKECVVKDIGNKSSQAEGDGSNLTPWRPSGLPLYALSKLHRERGDCVYDEYLTEPKR